MIAPPPYPSIEWNGSGGAFSSSCAFAGGTKSMAATAAPSTILIAVNLNMISPPWSIRFLNHRAGLLVADPALLSEYQRAIRFHPFVSALRGKTGAFPRQSAQRGNAWARACSRFVSGRGLREYAVGEVVPVVRFRGSKRLEWTPKRRCAR